MIKKILIIFCSLIAFNSCKVTHEILSGDKYNNKIAIEELNRDYSDNTFPFTLNSKLSYGCPIVNYPLNGNDANFILDTGSKYNGITNKGLEKLGYNVYDFQVKLLPIFIKSNKLDSKLLLQVENKNKKVIDMLLKQMIKSFEYGNAYLVKINGIEWGYGRIIDSELDGILGQDFLKENKIVTLNFIDNTLKLNDEKITSNTIKMEWNDFSHLVIKFVYMNNIENAIIDTGNYTFTPRNNLGKKSPLYNISSSDIKSQNFVKNYKEKKVLPIIHTYNGITIGNLQYNNIKGLYANILFSGYDKNVRLELLDTSSLGCSFFKGYILQLDYENMEMSLSK